MNASSSPDEQKLNYEQAREELVAVVQKLEAGAPLEESLALWERGERLAGICQERLDGAKERVAAARRTAEDEEPDAAET
ncbi:MAG: exodeoxyribonuclease VII small subunit [Propionibacteriales bacterium]|nr:exodeoxyribonuclease VII small subunit [Propionibacteriales bacterium]